MDRNEMKRILLEGALNGIGFVIGSAIIGWLLSLLFFHAFAVLLLPVIGVVLWLGFKKRRVIKDKLRNIEMANAIRRLEQK
jgi:hypothetical protein